MPLGRPTWMYAVSISSTRKGTPSLLSWTASTNTREPSLTLSASRAISAVAEGDSLPRTSRRVTARSVQQAVERRQERGKFTGFRPARVSDRALDRFGDRSERHGAAAADGASLEDEHSQAAGTGRGLRLSDHARLTDARLADDRENRSAACASLSDQGMDHADFAGAAHDYGAEHLLGSRKGGID